VRDVMTWPTYEIEELERRAVPVVHGFVPAPHSSRKGWVASAECYPRSPFTCDPNVRTWRTSDGATMSLREIAGRTTRHFWSAIRALGDPLSLQLIGAVMRGRVPSLLELSDRPVAYDDVGRLCRWDDLFPITLLPRSRYERVIGHAIARRRVRIEGGWHRPVGVQGWTHVVLQREHDGVRRVRSLDELLAHLDAWDRTADRRRLQRRRTMAMREHERRAREERRIEPQDTGERRRRIDEAGAQSVAASPKEASAESAMHEVAAPLRATRSEPATDGDATPFV
jgi:hypothetical protein